MNSAARAPGIAGTITGSTGPPLIVEFLSRQERYIFPGRMSGFGRQVVTTNLCAQRPLSIPCRTMLTSFPRGAGTNEAKVCGTVLCYGVSFGGSPRPPKYFANNSASVPSYVAHCRSPAYCWSPPVK